VLADDVINEYFNYGVRFMLVLLEDDVGAWATDAYCQQYASKYGLPLDKIVVATDPLKKSMPYYIATETSSVSLSVITDRKGIIVYTDEINAVGPFKWQIDYELKQMCDELAEGTDPWPDNIHQLCTVKYGKDMPDSP
jgi:hypothetical protein